MARPLLASIGLSASLLFLAPAIGQHASAERGREVFQGECSCCLIPVARASAAPRKGSGMGLGDYRATLDACTGAPEPGQAYPPE